jgi:hypothetical protein
VGRCRTSIWAAKSSPGTVPISQLIRRRAVVRDGIADLLRRPGRGRMVGAGVTLQAVRSLGTVRQLSRNRQAALPGQSRPDLYRGAARNDTRLTALVTLRWQIGCSTINSAIAGPITLAQTRIPYAASNQHAARSPLEQPERGLPRIAIGPTDLRPPRVRD